MIPELLHPLFHGVIVFMRLFAHGLPNACSVVALSHCSLTGL